MRTLVDEQSGSCPGSPPSRRRHLPVHGPELPKLPASRKGGSSRSAGGEFGARSGHQLRMRPLAGALDDELADGLGQCGEDVEDQPSDGRSGVERLVQRPELDVALSQLGDDRDQVCKERSSRSWDGAPRVRLRRAPESEGLLPEEMRGTP